MRLGCVASSGLDQAHEPGVGLDQSCVLVLGWAAGAEKCCGGVTFAYLMEHACDNAQCRVAGEFDHAAMQVGRCGSQCSVLPRARYVINEGFQFLMRLGGAVLGKKFCRC